MQTKKTIVLAVLLLSIGMPLYIHGSGDVDTAVSWLYQNGLTKYTNATTFKSNNTIRRDEASKFFSVFAKNILQRPNISTSSSCMGFSDLDASNSMKTEVLDSCSRGYILGNYGKFYPKSSLTNAQAVAIIIRMIEGKKDESGKNRADAYYVRAKEFGLLDGLNLSNKSAIISRGTLGILLYRAGLLPGVDTYAIETTKANITTPLVRLLASSNNVPSSSFISINVGDTFTISGMPKNLEGMNYYYGGESPGAREYARAFFSDQTFIDNNSCVINDASTDNERTISCDAKKEGLGYFYIVIYNNGKQYKSNTVAVKIGSSSILETPIKPDLVINSLSLDATYPSPKVGDQAPYIKATIKNIGGSITFSSTNKMILSCGSAIKKEITNGTLGANQSMTIEGLTNLPGTYPDMFADAKNNYTINCNVSLQSSTVYESNENNNTKSFSISMQNIATGPDFVITSLILDPAYSVPKANDEYVHLIMNVKNIGSTMKFASNNRVIISCGNNTQFINKQITGGTLGQNESRDIELTNTYDPTQYLFPAPEKNYHINCTFLPANNNSTPELVVNESNYKSIYFDVN